MGITVIITMGVASFVGTMISKLLMSTGKPQHAQFVDLVVMGFLISCAITCVAEVIKALYTLV